MTNKPFTIVYFEKAVPGVNKYACAPENKQMQGLPGGCIIRQGKETVVVKSDSRKPTARVFLFFVRKPPKPHTSVSATFWELSKDTVPCRVQTLCFDTISQQINEHDTQNTIFECSIKGRVKEKYYAIVF